MLALSWGVLGGEPAVKAGDVFPDLGAQSLEGKVPGDLKGKVVLVDFWASWCGPCKLSFPVLEELHQKYKERGLVVLAVSVDDKASAMEAFLKKRPVSFAVVRDGAHKLVSAVNVSAMPTSFILGPDGKVRHVHTGFHGEETKQQYMEEIEALLKEKS